MPVNMNMLQQAIAILQQQGQGDFAGAIPQAKTPTEPVYGVSKPARQPEPSDAFASIPTNAYYGTMAAKAQDPFFGGGHFAGLKMAAADGQEAYAEQLARAQENTRIANEQGGRTEVMGEMLKNSADIANSNSPGLFPAIANMQDPAETTRLNVNNQNTTDAENRKTNAEANTELFKSGVVQDTDDLAQQMTGPFANELISLKSRLDAAGFTPDESIDLLKAKAAMLSAQARMRSADASMISANRPRGSGKNKDDGDDDSSPTGSVLKRIFGR